MKFNSLLHTLACLTLSLTFASADHHGEAKKALALGGAWKAKAESDTDTRSYTFTFEEKDGKWSGKSEDKDGNVREMDRIKVEGNKATLETDMESNGQTGIIRVSVEADESGNALKGKWAVVDSSDAEYMSGDFSAERLFELTLVGEWSAVATVGEEEMEAAVQFKKDDESKVVGSFTGEDDKEVTFSKVTTDEKEVTLEFTNAIDGNDLDFRISAEAKSADLLEGKWVVFDASGQEGYSGQWLAKRVQPFVLAGEWKATSELPDGASHSSTYTIEEKDEKYSGKVASDAGGVDLSSVTLKDDKVTIAFPYGEATVTIKAEVKDGKLDGKWSMLAPDGQELSGKWTGTRKE